jgi:glycosyltransferase involved in cell wall biosynthesis
MNLPENAVEQQTCIVSVIIPTYNVSKYLGECLDSVLQQSLREIEIICVEDGSADDTLDVIKKYSAADSRVKLICYGANKGTAYARNRGLEYAKGKYIYFLDADDLIKPDIFSKLVRQAEINKTDCIYFDSELWDEEHIGNLKLQFELPDAENKIFTGEDFFSLLMKHEAYTGSVWRQFWRREYLISNQLQFPEGMLAEDADFSVKAMLLMGRCMCRNESLHIYRRHGGTMSTDLSPRKAISLFKIYCNLLKFWNRYVFSDEANRYFEDFLNMRLDHARRLYMRNKKEVSENDFEAGLERYLFHVLLSNSTRGETVKLKSEEILELRSAEEVIVYGAGNYAVDVVAALENQEIPVTAIAVTQKHANTTTINDLPIYELEELKKCHSSAVVVIGVKNKKNREEIIESLREINIRHIIDPIRTENF